MDPKDALLATQEKLTERSDDEMLEQYGIRSKRENGLLLLDYDQTRVDWRQPYGHVCRGLILREDNLDVVAFGLAKFFNLGEVHAAPVLAGDDIKGLTFIEKMDGTMLQRFWNPLAHRFDYSTRFQLPEDLARNEVALGLTWQNLIDTAAQEHFNVGRDPSKWRDDYRFQDPKETWTLELCSRLNKVVVDYPEPKLTLLARRRRDTLEELPIDEADFPHRPRTWTFAAREHALEFVEARSGPELEGFVVKDAAHNRVKLKGSKYVALHAMRGGLTSFGALVEMAVGATSGDTEELLVYFPEYRPVLDKIRDEWESLVRRHEEAYGKIRASNPENQKAFAELVQRYGTYFKEPPQPLEFPSALFLTRAGKAPSVRAAFDAARPSAKVDLLRAKVQNVNSLLPGTSRLEHP